MHDVVALSSSKSKAVIMTILIINRLITSIYFIMQKVPLYAISLYYSRLYILCIFLQGATIVDQIVSITPAENYVPKSELRVELLLYIQISWLFSFIVFELILWCHFLQEVHEVDNDVSMTPENSSPSAPEVIAS